MGSLLMLVVVQGQPSLWGRRMPETPSASLMKASWTLTPTLNPIGGFLEHQPSGLLVQRRHHPHPHPNPHIHPHPHRVPHLNFSMTLTFPHIDPHTRRGHHAKFSVSEDAAATANSVRSLQKSKGEPLDGVTIIGTSDWAGVDIEAIQQSHHPPTLSLPIMYHRRA